VDVVERKVVGEWREIGVYVTEADFVPYSSSSSSSSSSGSSGSRGVGEEDEGVLLSVVYNTTTDTSSLVVLDATTMETRVVLPLLGDVLSFHAHGK